MQKELCDLFYPNIQRNRIATHSESAFTMFGVDLYSLQLNNCHYSMQSSNNTTSKKEAVRKWLLVKHE